MPYALRSMQVILATCNLRLTIGYGNYALCVFLCLKADLAYEALA